VTTRAQPEAFVASADPGGEDFPSTLEARAAEVAALPEGSIVPSPCINVCRIDPASGVCAGCRRSLDEIAAWSRLDDAGKRIVWARLARHPRD
jgi:predicted Fe-S protein YdhL (DUF1289 family)